MHSYFACTLLAEEKKIQELGTITTTTEDHPQTRLQKGNSLLALHSSHMQNTLQWRPVGETQELLTTRQVKKMLVE